MNGFMNWYTRNSTQITWFIIGWLSLCTLVNFGKGELGAVAFDLVLIALNYFLRQK